MAIDPQTDNTRWLACTGCSGEIGIPLDWIAPKVKCPNCGREVAIETVPQVLWRPKQTVADSQRKDDTVVIPPDVLPSNEPPIHKPEISFHSPSPGKVYRPSTDSAQQLTNGFAMTGLGLGIASVFLSFIGIIPILAIIFSGIGLAKSHERGGVGQVQAWIGLILGIVFTLVYLNMYGHIR